MKEEKSVIGAISEAIANAIGDESFTLPLAAWQTSSPASEEINASYSAEIKAYKEAPTSPCNKATALKLLKRFARKDFGDFWVTPTLEYLPAVSEGTISKKSAKLCNTEFPDKHKCAACYHTGNSAPCV